jgi:hypothetical protein
MDIGQYIKNKHAKKLTNVLLVTPIFYILVDNFTITA